MNQIINMIIRQVMNQVLRRGINAGFDRMGRRNPQQSGRSGHVDDHGNAVEHLSPEDLRQQQYARKQSSQAKKSMKSIRRITRL